MIESGWLEKTHQGACSCSPSLCCTARRWLSAGQVESSHQEQTWCCPDLGFPRLWNAREQFELPILWHIFVAFWRVYNIILAFLELIPGTAIEEIKSKVNQQCQHFSPDTKIKVTFSSLNLMNLITEKYTPTFFQEVSHRFQIQSTFESDFSLILYTAYNSHFCQWNIL